jgi:diadenosine tetraphosphate (Ap4A) HIT family hydrolase
MTEADCVMCTRVAGEGPLFVADLPTSRVYFNEDQFFPGWVFVVLKRHAVELYELTHAERATHIEDVNQGGARPRARL